MAGIRSVAPQIGHSEGFIAYQIKKKRKKTQKVIPPKIIMNTHARGLIDLCGLTFL